MTYVCMADLGFGGKGGYSKKKAKVLDGAEAASQ